MFKYSDLDHFNSLLQTNIKFLMFVCLLLPKMSLAYDSAIQKFVSKQEQSLVQHLGDDVLEALYLYRKEVESKAYLSTLKLCEGYRRAKRMDYASYHGRYMFTEYESAMAWKEVLTEGALEPISKIAGLKADFLRRGNYLSLDSKRLFLSMYTMYLVNSFEFLSATVHCLELPMDRNGNIDATEIYNFSNAILIADAVGTTAGNGVLGSVFSGLVLSAFWLPAKLFPMIAMASKFSLFPLKRLLNSLAQRVTKPRLQIAGLAIGYLAIDNLKTLIKTRDENQNTLLEMLDSESSLSLEFQKRKRFILLNEVFEHFYESYKQEQKLKILEQDLNKLNQDLNTKKQNLESLEIDCQSCVGVYKSYFIYIKTNITEDILTQMQNDLEQISKKNILSEQDKVYKTLLEGFLEVLIQHFNTQN